jgi:LmbE family N-acetylglucosaminyl deacetylase
MRRPLCCAIAVALFFCSQNMMMGKSKKIKSTANPNIDPDVPEIVADFPTLPDFEGDLFVVFAHADDELLSLAYVAKIKELNPKKAIHWILVSDSGKGWAMPFSCRGKNIAKCRSLEAQSVASCVGIPPPFEMKLHDGALKNYPNLDSKIYQVIQKLKVNKVGAILTSDNTGVYGHPDHLAVHDAVARLSLLHSWTMITNALPPKVREKIKLRNAAKSREDPCITHIVDLSESLKKKLVCAFNANKSQRLLLWMMNQMHKPEVFVERVPRQFFNVFKY